MIEQVQWRRVADKIKDFHPKFYELLEHISHEVNTDLYLARYSYGAEIIDDKGHFRLPDKLYLRDASDEVQSELNYNQYGIPLGVILKGQCEKFLEETDPICSTVKSLDSLRIYRAGDLFGTEHISKRANNQEIQEPFQISSGIRTAFIVPGIRNSTNFERLQQKYNGYNKLEMPNSIRDHGRLFKSIANHANFHSKWYTEVLFFPKEWLNALKKKSKLSLVELEDIFTQIFQKQNGRCNNLAIEDTIKNKVWEKLIGHYGQYSYSLILRAIMLLQCGLGKHPVYHICNSNDGGPFIALAEALENIYRWKQYAPIIMQPTYLHWLNDVSGYVSMSHNTRNSSDVNSYNSKASDATKIKDIITLIMKRAKQCPTLLQQAGMSELTNIKITFHHYDSEKTHDMLPSNSLFENNPEIKFWLGQGKNIAYSNHFLRCCAKSQILNHNFKRIYLP